MFSPGLGCGRVAPSDMRKSLSVIRVLVVELPADSDKPPIPCQVLAQLRRECCSVSASQVSYWLLVHPLLTTKLS